MAIVWVPSLLRPLCGGAARLEVDGATLGDLLRAVDEHCPGFLESVVESERLRPEIAVAINGEAGSFSLHEPLAPGVEISILPAMAGG